MANTSTPLDGSEESISDRIARLRKERGFSQAELAERIGIIQALVSSSAILHDSKDFDFTIAVEMPRKKKEDSSFGPRLTAVRRARGLTQVRLAKAAGTTQRAISYYETDDGIPPAAAVIALAKALRVTSLT